MTEIEKRMKKIRKELDLKQGEFAKRLEMSQGALSDFENGRRLLSDRNIKLICLTFGVSERWLREGIGEMFTPLSNLLNEKIIGKDGKPLTEDEVSLIEIYRSLIVENKRYIFSNAETALKCQKNTIKFREKKEDTEM